MIQFEWIQMGSITSNDSNAAIWMGSNRFDWFNSNGIRLIRMIRIYLNRIRIHSYIRILIGLESTLFESNSVQAKFDSIDSNRSANYDWTPLS